VTQFSLKHVRATFAYDPVTGEFRWKRIHGLECPVGPLAGRLHDGYLVVTYCRKMWRVHRLIWVLVTGSLPKHDVDHINRNRTDNRWCNLREATRKQNSQNKGTQKNNTSGFTGVTLHKGKFRAQICVDRKLRHLGYFPTAEEASSAYLAAKRELHPYSQGALP
jgi:hypothetical protein